MSTDRGQLPDLDAKSWRRPQDDPKRLKRAPIRAAIVAGILRREAVRLGVRLDLPDGTSTGSTTPQAQVLRLNNPEALYRRIVASGVIGSCESYQAGEWDAEDLPGLLTLIARRAVSAPRWQLALRRITRKRIPGSENGTVEGARRNIRHHYDLSNDLFALFLDETLTYSSALFDTDEEGEPLFAKDDLASAQRRKINRVLDLAGVGPGTRLLEIGTGWGELAIAAARRGASVHTVTLSAEQCELARHRVAQAALADRVRVDLSDYRGIEQVYQDGYDALVSVEMIEAVGEEHWPDYFRTLDRLLAPGGRTVLQVITSRHSHLMATRDAYTWCHKYIFPGGLIPSLQAIDEVCRKHTRLLVRDAQGFGTHYARTLQLWRERFEERGAEVATLGFDENFRRTWRLYLSLSEAGFTSGYLDVRHLVLERAT